MPCLVMGLRDASITTWPEFLAWITSSGVGGFVPPRCCCTAGLPGSGASAAPGLSSWLGSHHPALAALFHRDVVVLQGCLVLVHLQHVMEW